MKEADRSDVDILMLQAEVRVLRMAVAFLVSELDVSGPDDASTSIINALMGQHAHAVGKDARACFAIEDLCDMIATLRDA
ncbi:hypothetical protein [Mameliella alba]|uniref:hypothetical protein n=1 Tax=Mameliella alba TaxID=561184 RepID=UPI000B52D6B7|nr:hypothetical protein [Mameliella alba]OWV43224.1 hypothetical protein CDZ95_10555 [Mameliella alba]BBU57431.1 hypothetical protein KU6B_36960 [Mameliella alba]